MNHKASSYHLFLTFHDCPASKGGVPCSLLFQTTTSGGSCNCSGFCFCLDSDSRPAWVISAVSLCGERWQLNDSCQETTDGVSLLQTFPFIPPHFCPSWRVDFLLFPGWQLCSSSSVFTIYFAIRHVREEVFSCYLWDPNLRPNQDKLQCVRGIFVILTCVISLQV